MSSPPVDPSLEPRRWILQSNPNRRTWDVVGDPPETSTDVVEVVEALPARSDEVVVTLSTAEAHEVVTNLETNGWPLLESARSKLSTALDREEA